MMSSCQLYLAVARVWRNISIPATEEIALTRMSIIITCHAIKLPSYPPRATYSTRNYCNYPLDQIPILISARISARSREFARESSGFAKEKSARRTSVFPSSVHLFRNILSQALSETLYAFDKPARGLMITKLDESSERSRHDTL